MDVLKGKDLIIKANGVAIAAAKSCSVKVSAKDIETASPNDGQWEHSLIGRKSWRVETNHLVVSLPRSVQMVGTTVSLTVCVEGSYGKGFSGFVNNVTIASGTYTGTLSLTRGIFWDKTAKKFLLKIVPTAGVEQYFAAWTVTDSTPYTSPSDYDLFSYNGTLYSWLNNDLMAEKLLGSAHILTWNASGAIGNLMMGSFSFKGTGPLTPASLPATT